MIWKPVDTGEDLTQSPPSLGNCAGQLKADISYVSDNLSSKPSFQDCKSFVLHDMALAGF